MKRMIFGTATCEIFLLSGLQTAQTGNSDGSYIHILFLLIQKKGTNNIVFLSRVTKEVPLTIWSVSTTKQTKDEKQPVSNQTKASLRVAHDETQTKCSPGLCEPGMMGKRDTGNQGICMKVSVH